MHDVAELYLDTSGAGLHKRGYRANSNAAPLRETLAAAMVKLARWRGRDPFLDPFCGSGTIAIEAAMIAQRRAPGLLRRFDAEKWSCFDKSVWQQARESALDLAQPDAKFDIVGSDIDPDCVQLSIENARKAGVANTVFFRARGRDQARLQQCGRSCLPIRRTVSVCWTCSRRKSCTPTSAERQKTVR